MNKLLWAAGFALGTAFLGLAFAWLEAPGQPPVSVDLDALSELEPRFAALANGPARPRELRVAFFGDSTSMHFAERRRGVDARLEAALARRAREVRPQVFSFALLGATPFTYYFLASRVAAARPDFVVLAFNLHAFSAQWRQAERPRLAAWLPLRQLGEALSLPLHWIGLDASELLLYAGVVRAGAAESWLRMSRLQAHAVQRWRDAETALEERLFGAGALGYRGRNYVARHAAWFRPGVPERETPELVAARLGPALAGVLPDHPALEVLGAALDVFEARGIEALVYVVPVNVEHHERLGAYSREALTPTIATVRSVVEAHGAAFLDLSTLLPDAAFLDGSSHLAVGAPLDAPPLVVEPLARALLPDGRGSPR